MCSDADVETANCPLRFQGQSEDAESGLYYNLNRYYDPRCGMYLSPDPIGLAGGLRPNGYVHNPTTYIDPWGLIEEILSNKSITYRGDTRSPQKIFSEGFVTKGTNTDLHRYGMLNEPSVFVSSSKDFKIAREFAMDTARATRQSTGWVYTINNNGNGIDMNASLRDEDYFYRREREVAFRGGVKPENIVLAMEVDANNGEVIRKIKNLNFKPVKLNKICRK